MTKKTENKPVQDYWKFTRELRAQLNLVKMLERQFFELDDLCEWAIRNDVTCLDDKSGERVSCRYLVGADGSHSRVRRWLKPDTDRGILVMEQYVEKGPENVIEVGLSLNYDIGGYFYRFPNTGFDVVGFGDVSTTPEKYRRVMQERGYSDKERARGAYIYLSNDYPLKDHVILIGDAGGFANRTTCEGLYDSFMTARNAATAIIEQRPFREVNDHVFRRMEHEVRVTKWFFTPGCFRLIRFLCHFPWFIRWCFDTKMKRETWINKSK